MESKILAALLLILWSSLSLNAQSIFTFSGELRPRTEYNHGTKSLMDEQQEAGIFTSQRTRLNMDFENSQLKVRLVLQDVRTWGSQPQLVVSDGLTSIHEAWADIEVFKNFSLKAGRQEIAYDDHRIFGNVGWAQQARSHDAAVLKYENAKGFKAHAGFAYNQNGPVMEAQPYTVPASYKAMQYVWLHHKFGKLKASALLLNNGKLLNEKISYSQTVGSRFGYNLDKMGLNVNYYHQLGADGAGRKLNASLVGVDVNYQMIPQLKAVAGFEIQSGNSQSDLTEGYQTVNHAFTPFYGTNHKFNGFMDYFYVGNHIGEVGLQDLFVELKYQKNKISIGTNIHHFSTQADLADPENINESMKSYLGAEVDLSASYVLSNTVNCSAGYSQLFASKSMEVLKGGRADLTNNFAYLMLTITPEFFSIKKD